ncbi:MAG: M23 family metallopeptidase [Candidatus Gastranaerophilales bacterium]|nr:M23 family metallopeptidase [Candidatus Gastranaerophilales bacterium]
MRKDRKVNQNNIKRERMIMVGSSVFVLAALTMTGIYMRKGNADSQDNGYVVDFTELEDRTDQKLDELAQNYMADEGKGGDLSLEDDLDYLPLEEESLEPQTTLVGSAQVDNALPEETQQTSPEVNLASVDSTSVELPKIEEQKFVPENEVGAGAGDAEQLPTTVSAVSRELHFSESDGLIRPVEGEVLIPYSMDQTVRFKTLAQYKYNPAVIFQAEVGTNVSACAEGQVIAVYQDSEIGHAVRLDLGDGYQVVYGQLQDIRVAENDYVNAGDTLGSVAAPTIYFCEDGSNLYFELTRNGEEMNPEELF